jgi:hypothetical protein
MVYTITVSTISKMKIYKTVLKLVVRYECETWSLSEINRNVKISLPYNVHMYTSQHSHIRHFVDAGKRIYVV